MSSIVPLSPHRVRRWNAIGDVMGDAWRDLGRKTRGVDAAGIGLRNCSLSSSLNRYPRVAVLKCYCQRVSVVVNECDTRVLKCCQISLSGVRPVFVRVNEAMEAGDEWNSDA
jgi:hypothetical protein